MLTHFDASSLSEHVAKQFDRSSQTNRYVKLGLIFGGAVSVGYIAREIYRQTQARRQIKASEAHVDAALDKALKGSFPASDPPASQFFDIPINRQ